ncbi:MAG: DUF1573 domain-containing protein [Chitinivibrionales bacterium]|nr:DUF1573 domain-containing protein [Chitinivibrionales bacterium]
MIRYILILFTAIFVASPLHAGPRLQVEETEYFAGTFLEGQVDTISHDFILKNTGDEPLYVLKVHPGCGCTKFHVDKKIAPGGSGKISIKVDVSKFMGFVKKTTTVLTDADNQQTIRLTMKARIEPVISVSEEFIRFGPSDIKEKIRLTTDTENLIIESVKYNAYLTKSVHPVEHSLQKYKEQDKEGAVQYALKLHVSDRPARTSPGKFIITTNHPQKKTIEIGGLILVGNE